MQNIFLLHLRERCRLNLHQIEECTGIKVQQYEGYEKGASLISTEDLELLSTLFGVKKEHLESYSRQLHFFSYYKDVLDHKDKKIQRLTQTLKRKIRMKAPGREDVEKPF